MSGHSSYEPSTGLEKWVDARLPLPRMVYDSFIAYPVPRNLNYAYTFGAMLSVMLIVQILTGVVLAMHYAADTTIAFNSVEKIMRDVNHGWLLRYMHANGASFFFIAVYLHIARGLYYGSYKAPREILWILGCVPLGQAGEYNGWFCPCHGSVYDTAGRIRKGPAPQNLAIPTFSFVSDTKIKIG